MKVYSLEFNGQYEEFYDFKSIKKKATELIKLHNEEVLITCRLQSGKQNWYTMLPTGELVVDAMGYNPQL